MYQGIKSCIDIHNEYSELFPCNIGVRHSENVSPVLFSLYLNDSESYLQSHNRNGVSPDIDDIVRNWYILTLSSLRR